MTHDAHCSECRSLLGGYVLHALEPDEAETVRHHLVTCEACAAEHGELIGLPELLDVAGSTEPISEKPPAALEEAVLDRFARETPDADERPSAPRRALARLRGTLVRPLPAALTGAVAAAAVTAALIALPGGGDDPGSIYEATLSGTSSIPQARASADLKVVSTGTRVNLKVRGLRGQPDNVYELWCVRDDGVKVSAGTFRTDSAGSADVSLTTAAVPGEYHRLSVERRSVSPAGDSGERVMAGEIEYPRW
jgi:anti-sigma factor RsiW